MNLIKPETIKSNYIHPTAIIGNNVIYGKNNYIGPYCVIKDGTIIGNNNRFEAFVSINTPGEHRDYMRNDIGNGVIIGDNNIIREYVTINGGTIHKTVIGNDNIMLQNSHCGHDTTIENNVTISCNAILGGHSYIMEGVNMALGSICHQYSVIGSFAMCGMGCIVTKSSKIEPGNIYVGSPAKLLKANTIGLQRANMNNERLLEEEERYNTLCRKGV